jgi:hypothetical protein
MQLFDNTTNIRKTYLPFASLFVFVTTLSATAQQPPAAAAPTRGNTEHNHCKMVDHRGDQAMGFNHNLTGHHFHLFAKGGAIEVEANNAGDVFSRSAIREHMSKIATMFTEGNFSLPMFIHDAVPPGVETMKRLKDQIVYSAENTSKGAQVRINTNNPEAVKAIHHFLRFQITEHRTGDSMDVKS